MTWVYSSSVAASNLAWREACVQLAAQCLVTRPGNLAFSMEALIGQVPLHGARVLDVGGGAGFASLYAALAGAREVVCLEPSAAGSRPSRFVQTRDAVSALAQGRVTFVSETFQSYAESDPGRFDVVLSNASINHLDERACERLMSPDARGVYAQLCQSFRALVSCGGKLLISDCRRRNLLEDLGIRHPLRRSIEPRKHWDPDVWVGLFEEAGFRCSGIRYLGLNCLRLPGAILLDNSWASYLGSGDFRLIFDAVSTA
jgi:SAM-dependent methyltransferase